MHKKVSEKRDGGVYLGKGDILRKERWGETLTTSCPGREDWGEGEL